MRRLSFSAACMLTKHAWNFPSRLLSNLPVTKWSRGDLSSIFQPAVESTFPPPPSCPSHATKHELSGIFNIRLRRSLKEQKKETVGAENPCSRKISAARCCAEVAWGVRELNQSARRALRWQKFNLTKKKNSNIQGSLTTSSIH